MRRVGHRPADLLYEGGLSGGVAAGRWGVSKGGRLFIEKTSHSGGFSAAQRDKDQEQKNRTIKWKIVKNKECDMWIECFDGKVFYFPLDPYNSSFRLFALPGEWILFQGEMTHHTCVC